jgi:TolB protein
MTAKMPMLIIQPTPTTYFTRVRQTYAPQLLKKRTQANDLDFRPYEIYLSKLDGSQISRLTKSSGYDAEASLNRKGSKIVFVSTRSGSADLYLMPFSISEWTKKSAAFERALEIERNISSTSPSKAVSESRIVRLTNDSNYDSNPVFVPQTDQILWIKYSADLKSSQIVLGDQSAKNAHVINSKVSLNWSPFFHPTSQNEFVFSSNRGDGVHFNLYTLDLAGQCLKRLTDSPNDEILPAFSPDGKKLLFTSNRSGKNQIYLIDYISPLACLDELP